MAIKYTLNSVVVGRGERIRTSDPIVPNDVRYQAAPLPDSLILKGLLSSPKIAKLAHWAKVCFKKGQFFPLNSCFVPCILINFMGLFHLI